jgi:hypothetical protein
MTAAREFVDFWFTNCVHPDEQLSARRRREGVQGLADKLVIAANGQGLTQEQIEAEIGDIYAYIRAGINSQNTSEAARLKLDGQ